MRFVLSQRALLKTFSKPKSYFCHLLPDLIFVRGDNVNSTPVFTYLFYFVSWTDEVSLILIVTTVNYSNTATFLPP